MAVVSVAGRQIYINTQKTQTVKICDSRNQRGVYEKYYRITPPYVLQENQLVQTILRFKDLQELENWLINDRKAIREPQNETIRNTTVVSTEVDDENDNDNLSESPDVRGAVAEVLDLLNADQYSPDADTWLVQAKELVEQSIDRFLAEFIQSPYLHRVEHSIHVELFRIMKSHQELSQCVPIGDSLAMTQLIHKEWPETVARENNRRGNFDLVLLTPLLLNGCPSISAFRGGHLHAPIVIEMGLDYDAEHLARDAKKLINSRPKHGYLIHLARELPRDHVTEQIILGVESRFGIKAAYAWIFGEQAVFKKVNDQTITENQ